METSRLTQVLLLAVLVSVVSGGTEDAFIMEDNAKLPILWNQATNAQVDLPRQAASALTQVAFASLNVVASAT